MKYRFTVKTDDIEDIKDITNTGQMRGFLFELTHNFKRIWKHSDDPPSSEEVIKHLDKLLDDYNIHDIFK